MKVLFLSIPWKYSLATILLILVTGAALYPVVHDLIVLLCVLIFEGLILLIMFRFACDKKPLQKATRTVDELIKGNYRARMYHTFDGEIGELTQKVNILAKKLSESSLQEQIRSEQLASVVNHTHSALLFMNERGYIQLVNQDFLSMFHLNEKDCYGYLYYDVISNVQVHEMVRDIFLYEKNFKSNITIGQSVSHRYMEMSGVPIFNERGMLKGAVLVFYDITELKKLENMRKDFVANVSHELKTPITSIKGFSETLLDEELDEKTRHSFLRIIDDESTRLHALIDDLLTLSSLEKEDSGAFIREVNLQKIVSQITPGFHLLAKKRHLTFSIDMPEELLVFADSNQLKQVLINIVSNAFNYTPANGSVSLKISENASGTIIEVSDTGIGMEEEFIPRIFERFYRLDEARSRDTGGTGLGLAIVKHIVQLHKWAIDVDSKPHKGTTITISILNRHGNENET